MTLSPPSATVLGRSYREHPHWLRYQRFFPGGLRVTSHHAPREQWWAWRGMSVHLDRVAEPDAPVKLLLLHGLGGYGRMIAPYGRLPSVAGLELLAPDLPGFGLTGTVRRPITYGTWVECVLDLLTAERNIDDRPVVLIGVGTGGRLAYDVAASAAEGRVAGVVATSLLDARKQEVRRWLCPRPELSGVAGPLGVVPGPLRQVRVPLGWMANVAAMSNHAQFADVACSDALGAGASVSLEFVRSFLAAAPALEPEDFVGPPVLLVSPEHDSWTPPLLSRRFHDRLAAGRRSAVLTGAGHLPIEESGLADWDRAMRCLLDEVGVW